jgi:hypothetical protein
MLRALSAFLLVFCLLSLVVQQDGLAGLFGIGSAALFALDLLVGKYLDEDRVPRARVGTIL